MDLYPPSTTNPEETMDRFGISFFSRRHNGRRFLSMKNDATMKPADVRRFPTAEAAEAFLQAAKLSKSVRAEVEPLPVCLMETETAVDMATMVDAKSFDSWMREVTHFLAYLNEPVSVEEEQ
jgi:hypothetical protein